MKTGYINAKILTMNKQQPQAEAMIVENGIIQAIGTNQEILSMKHEDDEIKDMQGKTICPGFIDAHSHFLGCANSLSQCNCSGAESFEEIIQRVKTFIQEKQIPEGQWVFGCNYDHNDLVEKEHPTKEILNQISLNHPIVLVHASSHMGVVNSLALKLQNLSFDTPDPKGGKYGREKGELSGYMEENAFINFQNHCPLPSIDQLMELIAQAQDLYASYGITTLQEGMVTPPVWQLLQEASRRGILKLDLIGYADLNHSRELMLKHDNEYHDHLRLGGYKVFLDGSPQGKTAWLTKPYLNSTDCGYPTLTDERLFELITQSLEDKQQLLAHCNGDAAAEQYITQFEKACSNEKNYRPVMIHAQLVRKDQLERMKKIGMIPSFFIAHTYYWGDVHIKNLGIERASTISPAHSALDLGIPFTFHQDCPVILPNMLETIRCATQRTTKSGIVLGEKEKITVEEALQAITLHAAYQYHEEKQKGSLEKGKVADFVILSHDPIENLSQTEILETIKEGKVVYQR